MIKEEIGKDIIDWFNKQEKKLVKVDDIIHSNRKEEVYLEVLFKNVLYIVITSGWKTDERNGDEVISNLVKAYIIWELSEEGNLYKKVIQVGNLEL